jgi:hypothetical protein
VKFLEFQFECVLIALVCFKFLSYVCIDALQQGVVYDVCNFKIINYSHVEYGSPLSLTKPCLN